MPYILRDLRFAFILAVVVLIALCGNKDVKADTLYVHTGTAFGTGGAYPLLGVSLRDWVGERDFFNSMFFGLGYLFQSVEVSTNLDSWNYKGNNEPKQQRLFLGLARSMDIIGAPWLEISAGLDAPFNHMIDLEFYASANLAISLADL